MKKETLILKIIFWAIVVLLLASIAGCILGTSLLWFVLVIFLLAFGILVHLTIGITEAISIEEDMEIRSCRPYKITKR